MMKIIVSYVFLLLAFDAVRSQYEDENDVRLKTELNLILWDMQDECSLQGDAKREFLLQKSIDSTTIKIENELRKADYIRTQAIRLQDYRDYIYSAGVERNWTLYTKCGDYLLGDTDYRTLINFANERLECYQNARINYTTSDGEDEVITHKGYVDELATCRNNSRLEELWMLWQERNLNITDNDLNQVLSLIHKAAEVNDETDARHYWQMLSEIDDGYDNADLLWEQIQPLYDELHKFVRVRLENYYNVTFDDEKIPVYLLGSKFGNDWSNIADIVLPHIQFYDELKVTLKKHPVQDYYKYADSFIKELKLKDLGKAFWRRSKFNVNHLTRPEVVNYCSSKYSQVLASNATTLSNYLDAYEASFEVMLNRHDFASLSLEELRLSSLRDALIAMGTLIGYNNFVRNDLVTKVAFNDELNRNTMLLLIALKVLPQIAYYRTVDEWRLNPTENPTETWWNYRRNIQGIVGIANNEQDFLEDEFILYNKPYISKFFASILQFQLLLSHYQINIFDESETLVSSFNKDENFREMISTLSARSGHEQMDFYHIDYYSEYYVLQFFAPLREYMENAPLEQVKPANTSLLTAHNITVLNSIQNDDVFANNNLNQTDSMHDMSRENNIILYSGIGVTVLVLLIVISVVIRFQFRRRKTNNRRFNT